MAASYPIRRTSLSDLSDIKDRLKRGAPGQSESPSVETRSQGRTQPAQGNVSSRPARTSRTHKMVIGPIKDEGWGELPAYLGVSDATMRTHFEYSEYATIEIELDENLRIVGGRVLPLKSGTGRR